MAVGLGLLLLCFHNCSYLFRTFLSSNCRLLPCLLGQVADQISLCFCYAGTPWLMAFGGLLDWSIDVRGGDFGSFYFVDNFFYCPSISLC